jgi:hypothetical protein
MNSKLTLSRNKSLAARLKEVLLNGHWIANTNYKELLLTINWKQATQKVQNLNSIAALTYHINYYLSGLLLASKNGKLEISDKYSYLMPPIQSENDWNFLVAELIHNSEKFVSYVESMEDQVLDIPFYNENYGTYLRNIEGVIEHCYYHLGQISLLKKIIR